MIPAGAVSRVGSGLLSAGARPGVDPRRLSLLGINPGSGYVDQTPPSASTWASACDPCLTMPGLVSQ